MTELLPCSSEEIGPAIVALSACYPGLDGDERVQEMVSRSFVFSVMMGGRLAGFVALSLDGKIGRIECARSIVHESIFSDVFPAIIDTLHIWGAEIVRFDTFRRGLMEKMARAGFVPVAVAFEKRI